MSSSSLFAASWPRLWLLGLLLGCSATSLAPTGSSAPAGSTAVAATPRSAGPASAALPLDPSITSGSWSNGFTYFLKRQRPGDQRIHLRLIVKAGSLHEEEDQRGVAHFVEHLAFNATRRFSKAAIVDFFERSGVSFGSDLNGETTFDRTEYKVTIPSDDPALLATALDIIEDWTHAISFAADDVQKERPIILAELFNHKTAGKRVGLQTLDVLLEGSRYLQRDPIGQQTVVEQVDPARIETFFQRWYQPGRMALVAIGDLEPTRLEPQLRARFGQLPAGTAQADPNTNVPVGAEPIAAVITDPEKTTSVASVLFKASAHPLRTEADFSTRLISDMASWILNRRLARLGQHPEAPFSSAASYLAAGLLGRVDLLTIAAHSKSGQGSRSLETLLAEVERLERYGITSAELGRAKSDFGRTFQQRVAERDTASLEAIAASLSSLFVNGESLMAPELEQQLGARVISEVGTAEVWQAAVQRLHSSQTLLIATGPARDAMPERSAMLAALRAVKSQPLSQNQEQAVAVQLVPQLPAAGRIVSEERIDELGVSVWQLSNGARIVLKPTDFAGDELLVKATSPGGNARIGAREYPSALYAADIVLASGAGQLERAALDEALAGSRVSVSPWIDELSEGFSGRAAPADVETMFQLLYLYATAPRRDASAFEAWRSSLGEQVRNRDLDPSYVFNDTINKELWGTEARRMVPSAELVAQIDLETALGFYRERFADVSDFTFVFVGKIDSVAFRPLVARYLASLPGNGRKETSKDLGLRLPSGIRTIHVRAGKEDKGAVRLLFHGEAPWSHEAHTDLVSLEIYLRIRLREVLRERLGGAYATYVNSSFERLPFDAYTLSIQFACKPADADKLVRAARDVVAEVQASGIGPTYVDKIKQERARHLEDSYRSNAFWLDRLIDAYRTQDDPRDILKLP
ncbi:MAG: hypothetical protein RL033_909, partial [Pseudomonadota bacterium]